MPVRAWLNPPGPLTVTLEFTPEGKPITLTVLCEGQTEQRFVTQVLAPHLRGFGVFPKGQLLKPGGGIVKFHPLRDAVSLVLRGRGHHCVTTMLDLYVGLLIFGTWVALTEPRRSLIPLWWVLLLLFGNMVSLAYLLRRSFIARDLRTAILGERR